jgi:hypothetical protein
MADNNIFYTYAYLREDKTPYYIGKGCGKRAYKKHGKLPVPPRDRILILKKDLTEAEALKHEIYMIGIFGRKDLGTGCLRNMTDGGDGLSGRVWTPEQRETLSEKHKGKKMSATARLKMSKAKTGRKLSEETRRKMSVKKKGKKLDPGHFEKLRQKCLKHNESCRGTTWWVNEDGKTTMAHDCPGEGWKRGRIWK